MHTGRTVPTYRLALEAMAQQWNDFRRALRKGDREAFDELMNKARMHASAATYAISMDPTESAMHVHAPGAREGAGQAQEGNRRAGWGSRER